MVLFSLPWQAVFNSSPAGTFLLSPTPEATILAVNDAGLERSFLKRKELIGISIFDAFPLNPADPDDSGVPALRHSLARVLASGKPHTLPTQRYPIPVDIADGDMEFEERFWNLVSTPIYGEDGKISCIALNSRDVTDQVRSRLAQNESDRRLRALTKASTDAVYRMSPDWTQMGQLEGHGFLKNTCAPHTFWLDDYIPPEDRELVHKAIAKAIGSKAIFELEHRVLRVDGSHGWTMSRAVPMLDARGEIYEWIGTASDITARKDAEEKLKQADLRKDEFLALLAHELRNPLAPISAAADLLRVGGADEARVRQISEIIRRQVVHMTDLVDDLLDVTRVAQGVIELDNASLDVSHVIEEAMEQLTPLIRSRRHQLKLELAPAAARVTGDKRRLVQVIANLVNNAAKYTHAGGHIVVRTEVRESDVTIAVIDSGIGMAPEMAARAFDLFAQAERTPERSSGGLGLGLALVKSLVELHGGTASCTSQGLGKGSTFTVRLPLLHANSSMVSSRHGDTSTGGVESPLRIMVVDDNVDAASMTAMLLEASGHQVLVEHEAHRALERARAVVPHVCLLDIGLREIGGEELAQRLRAQPETSRAVLIALTGYSQEKNRKKASISGFDRHLTKPVNTTLLTEILSEIRSA